MSYSVPLKVKIRLTVYDKDVETEALSIRDIKEVAFLAKFRDDGQRYLHHQTHRARDRFPVAPSPAFSSNAAHLHREDHSLSRVRGSSLNTIQKNLLTSLWQAQVLASIFLPRWDFGLAKSLMASSRIAIRTWQDR